MLNKNILLAEDEPTISRLVRTYFERDNYTVYTASNGEEAIKIFKDWLELTDYRKQVPEYYEAMALAVKALERQIPKKVKEFGFCPVCYYDFGYKPVKYCPECGQKLDWG